MKRNMLAILAGSLLSATLFSSTVLASDGILPGGTDGGGYGSGTGFPNTGLLDTGIMINNGDVWVWGFRGSGHQGNGVAVVNQQSAPAMVTKFTSEKVKIVDIAGGGAYHIIALDDKGDVWGWGQGGYGETGCDLTGKGSYIVSTPCRVLTGKNIIQIRTGEYFSMALGEDGQVYTWGHGIYGQRGDGTLNTYLRYLYSTGTPYEIPKSSFNGKVVLIGGAYEGGYAITDRGEIYGWGDNEFCQIAPDSNGNCPHNYITTPRRMTDHIKSSISGAKFDGNDVTYVAGGNGWVEFLLKDGTVWGVGRGSSIGLTGEGNKGYARKINVEKVVRLFARYVGSAALTADGKFYTWGETSGSAFKTIYGDRPTLRTPSSGTIKGFGGGKEHLYYWTVEGKAYGVGYGAAYKLDNQKTHNVEWPGVEIKYLNFRTAQ